MGQDRGLAVTEARFPGLAERADALMRWKRSAARDAISMATLMERAIEKYDAYRLKAAIDTGANRLVGESDDEFIRRALKVGWW
jgi:hypothetical protein